MLPGKHGLIRLSNIGAGSFGYIGCVGGQAGTTATGTTSDGTTQAASASTMATTGTSGEQSETAAPTSSSSATITESDGCSSVDCGSSTGTGTGTSTGCSPDHGEECMTCSPWDQVCPEGEKCSAWADDGNDVWSANLCVPAGDDTPGLPCSVEGSAFTGFDSCELGAICWDVDPRTNTGLCVGFCDGSPEAPSCSEPGTGCQIANNGVLPLCLPTCDPLAQDCPEGKQCLQERDHFYCFFGGDELGSYGEPCEFLNGCEVGLACVDGVAVPKCEAMSCCSPYCALDLPNQCPDAPEQTCQPWYEPGEAPEGYENLGICSAS